MLHIIVLVCIFGFLAAAVDAIAGGGGLISLPALLLAGIPPHLALGTNKFASTTASFSSSVVFARSGKVHWPLVKWLIPFTFGGASLGVLTVLKTSPEMLNKAVPVLMLGIGVFTVCQKNFGLVDKFAGHTRRTVAIGAVFAFVLGFYDGFFGPGTGSFLIFAFTMLGFNFLAASANAKVLNFTSNLASLILFAWNGKIAFYYGIPMAVFMIIGSFAGSKLAIWRGAKFVKPIFLIMSIAVAVKLIYQAI